MGLKINIILGSMMVLIGLMGMALGPTDGIVSLGAITFALGVFNIVLGFVNAYMASTKKYLAKDKA